jgi:hypothetical protein
MTNAHKSAGSATAVRETGFTADERAAMKERAREAKAASGPRAGRPDGETDLLAKVAEMPESDRLMAERLHTIIKTGVPDLTSTTWYGMPAYAKNGGVVCFFKPAVKFKARYATLGFSDKAKLDEGTMWPTEYALKSLTPVDEARIIELVKRAAS